MGGARSPGCCLPVHVSWCVSHEVPSTGRPFPAGLAPGLTLGGRRHIFRVKTAGLGGGKRELGLINSQRACSALVSPLHAPLPELRHLEMTPTRLPHRKRTGPPGSVSVCCEKGLRCPLWKFLWLPCSLMTCNPDYCLGGTLEESWRDFSGPNRSREAR